MQVLPPSSTGGPSRLFIMRPVATTLLMVAILLAGIIGYRALPVSALPEVDYPTIQVVTLYPGASPDVMTSAVTAPLERQFGQMSGLKQMSSQSSGGASVITLQFQLTLPLDVAEQEVQAAINAATNLLPSDLPNPPVYSKVNPADPPIMTLAVTSTAMPMTQVEDMVETRVAQKISQISGVGLVTLSGGQRPAVRVKLNAQAIAALGLTSETVRTAITGANVNSAKGSLDGPSRAVTLSANDQMQSAEEYRQLIIAYQNGAPIRLGDVATVEQGAENSWLGAWANKEQAIVMNVQRQPGANIISTADSIRQMLPQLTESLPKSVKVTVLSDRTTNIRASVDDTQFELMMAIALVVMIIYLFLRNIPATIIPGVAVPLSLIGTFAVMVFLDFSINNLTLMALTIATGFVVDDAIVVIENISRYIEKGEKPLAAALKGAGEIGFTIISLTFSLIAVLIPLLFMGDIVGRLFREFAITLAVAILISAVVSLTLTPMMCARMLSQESLRKQNRFSRASEKMFDRIIAAYGRGLAKVLNHPWLTLSVALSTLLLSVLLWVFIPKGFFPVQDNGIIQGTLQAPQSSSFANMAQRQRQVADVILQDPAVQSLTSFVGVMRRDFMADISHELRTPLAVLRGELEAIQDGVRKFTPETVASLQAEVGTLTKLVDDLHQLSMSDEGALAYQKAPVDLIPLLEVAGGAFRERFASRGLKLQFSLPDSITVFGDRDRLMQLFNNLLENSLRYTDSGGSLQISAGQRDKTVRLTFADSAPGVSDDQLQKLFERFYRTEGSRNRASGGSGLGLAICLNIVEAHNGRIIAAHSPFGGVSITVELPLERDLQREV